MSGLPKPETVLVRRVYGCRRFRVYSGPNDTYQSPGLNHIRTEVCLLPVFATYLCLHLGIF